MKYTVNIKKTIKYYEMVQAYDIIAKSEEEATEIALSGQAENYCTQNGEPLLKGEVLNQ
jgi:hypothetical protein